MIYYVTTDFESIERFTNIGIDACLLEDLPEVQVGSEVFMYDRYGIATVKELRDLVSKGIKLYYIFECQGMKNASSLISYNSFCIYKDIQPSNLNADLIENIKTKTFSKEEIKTALGLDINLTPFKKAVDYTIGFLDAINEKDKDALIFSFNHFDEMLKIKEEIEKMLDDKEEYRRLYEKGKTKVVQVEANLNKKIAELEALKESGRNCAEDNKRLVQAISNLAEEKDNVLDDLSKTKGELTSLAMSVDSIKKDKEDAEKALLEANSALASMKISNETLEKQIDTLFHQKSGSKIKSENLTVTLKETGNITKILYLKAIENIPNLLEYFNLYPKYRGGKTKRGCTYLIIFPEYSYQLRKYKDYGTLITSDNYMTVEDTDLNPRYIMAGYEIFIEDFIKRLKTPDLIILDLSQRDSKLLNTIIQNTVFILDSERDILDCGINPKEAISLRPLSSEVLAVLPKIELEDFNTAPTTALLKNSLFVPLDSKWN